LYGDVWSISIKHTDWGIIKVSHDIKTDINHGTLGLIIDNNRVLEINGDFGLFNSWYLN
jgi:hypothetical protein